MRSRPRSSFARRCRSRAAQGLRAGEVGTLARAVRWRIPGTPPEVTFRELFRRYPFTILAEGELWSVSGLCGRIWTIRRDYPPLSGPDEFGRWDEPGTARVALAHWDDAADDGRATLV